MMWREISLKGGQRKFHDFRDQPVVEGKIVDIEKNGKTPAYYITGYALPIKGVKRIRKPFEDENVGIGSVIKIEWDRTSKTSMKTRDYRVFVGEIEKADAKVKADGFVAGSIQKK